MYLQHISAGSEVLCISDGSLLPLLAVRLGAHHVYTIENNNMCCRVVKQFIKHNNLEDKVTVLKKTADNQDLRDTLAKVNTKCKFFFTLGTSYLGVLF